MNFKERFADLAKTIKPTATKLYGKVDENLPGILIVGGVIGLVASAVIACVESASVDEAVEETKGDIEELKGNKEGYEMELFTAKDYIPMQAKIVCKIGIRFAKKYGIPVLLGTVSAGGIFSGFNIINGRYISLLCYAATLERTINHYQEEIIARYGKEVDDEIRLGLKKEVVETPVLDKNGNPKLDKNGLPRVTQETLNIIDPEHIGDYSPYAFVWTRFNPDNTENHRWFEGSIQENLNTAIKIAKDATESLQSSFKGYWLYNDTRLAFGLPMTDMMTVGNHIAAHIDDPNFKIDLRPRIVVVKDDKKFSSEPQLGILIDPNVDGDIRKYFRDNPSYDIIEA